MKKLLLLCLVSLVIIAFEVSASSYKVETSSDKLEIGETFANVIPSLTSKEIPELQSSTIKTKGTTKYNQYLRFSGLPYPYTGLAKNSKNEVEDYLIVTRNTGATNAFFEYELEFESGLESDISSNSLKDLIGQQLYIFDQAYTITLATATGNTVEIQMLSGGASDTIEKGQTKQITLDSKTYNIKVLSVEQSTGKVKLEVDGQPISSMIKGEVQDIGNGNYIGITKILFSSGGSSNDMVEVFIGAQIIELKDKNYVDGNFEEEVKINTHKQTSAYVNIIASLSGTTLKISKIKYRVASILGQKVKKGTFLSDYLGDQVDSLLGNWDVLYQGLKTVPANAILFAPSGSDDEYKISFKNNNGNTFTNIPFLSSKGTFKLGDATNDLVIQENTAIDINDYFILTSRNDKTGNTYVLRYNSIDTTQQSLKIFDYSTSSEKSVSYQNSTSAGLIGTFELNIGTIKTNGTISSASGNALTVDLNTDGSAGSNVVYIVTEGGGVLVTEALAGSTYTMNLRTESSQFEENATDENIQFVFESRSGNKIGVQSTFTGITTTTKDNEVLGLSNYGVSMKYTDQGYIKVSIQHKKTETLCMIHLICTIEDSGIGIASENLEKIFSPFERVGDKQNNISGAGLGLAITNQYVQLMNGTIEVESTKGKGSIFTVTIPVEVRRLLRLRSGDKVRFVVTQKKEVKIKTAERTSIMHLYGSLKPRVKVPKFKTGEELIRWESEAFERGVAEEDRRILRNYSKHK